MKLIPFLLVFVCLTFNLSAQRKVEKFFDYNWKSCQKRDASFYSVREETDSGFVVTDYFLGNGQVQMTGRYSDSAGKVRDGYFTYYYPNGQVSNSGRYIANEKDGLWKGFYMDGRPKDTAVYKSGVLASVYTYWFNDGQIGDSVWIEGGRYYAKHWHQNAKLSSAGEIKWKGGKRLGEWVFYHYNGNKSAVIKYNTQGEMVSAQYFDEQGLDVTETATPFVNPRNDKVYKDWRAHLQTSYNIPRLAELKTPGKAVVVVSFSLDENGQVQNPEIKVPLHPKYDEAAIELIKSGPKWAAYVSHNRRIVGAKINQPVFFTK